MGGATICLAHGLMLSREKGQRTPSVESSSMMRAGGSFFSSAGRRSKKRHTHTHLEGSGWSPYKQTNLHLMEDANKDQRERTRRPEAHCAGIER